MCGFVGIHRHDGAPADAVQLQQLADLMHHRGPDGDGVWTQDGIGLAHRRLAIIDPSGSPQPMASHDGRLRIAFNGEVLNYRQIRAQLNYPFAHAGDTEVLLALFRERGIEGVEALRGQFAYALHDTESGETWLVRDRLGILPLFYVQQPGWVAFASEAKALLPLIPNLSVDEASLDLYLRRRSVPAPFTLFEGIRKLPPGCVARISREGAIEESRYWSPASIVEQDIGEQQAMRSVESAIEAAVDDNLVADVPVGAYLSGGLDSSLIAAIAVERRHGEKMHTFSAGFGDPRHDELPFARMVSGALGTEHHEVDVRPDDFEESWRRLTWHRDAPLSEPADVAVYRLAAAAAEHVKVVLSGEGADEAFAGYPKHRVARLSAAPVPRPVRAVLDRTERFLPPRLARVRVAARAMTASTPGQRMEAWFAPFTPRERAALLRQGQTYHELEPPAGSGSALHRMLIADCGPWLSDNLLERGDRMTMAASVELRPPFLDHRLVELGLSLPDRLKIRGGRGKWVLREIARERLPREILERPKVGFRVPLDVWFRGGLRDMAGDLLLDPSSFVTSVFDKTEVERLLTRHLTGRADENIRIWTLLGLEIWHQTVVAPSHRLAAG